MAVIRKHGEDDTLCRPTDIPVDKAVAEARKKLRVLSYGVKEGIVKGKNIIPDHTLALAIEADKSAYPAVEISYEQTISYLRHEAITLPENTPKGIVLLTYHGHDLGFAKNLGNRANNLYPQEWRIKSSHIPDNPKILISNIKTNEL